MKSLLSVIKESIWRGCMFVMSRPLYLVSIVVIPLLSGFIMLDLLKEGIGNHVPAAIVDLDGSDLSRRVTSNLDAMQTVDVKRSFNDFTEARDALQRGDIIGFFVIPENFAGEALAGRVPEITYYTNYAYFVPASLMYKGFKTISVLSNGALVSTTLVTAGLPESSVTALLMPYVNDMYPLGNPWMSYQIYMGHSFVPGILALMVMIITVYSITDEIKKKTSVEWLKSAGGSIVVALIGKLAPQTLLFTLAGWILQLATYALYDFPLNCNIAVMMTAMFLMVLASQAFAVTVCGIVPNLRLALSVCSLLSVLAFSIGGFTIPVEDMYRWIGIVSYILPIRYYFLIYIDQSLNGVDLYYSRYYFIALLVFVLVSFIPLFNLKRMCKKPVYVP